MTRITIEPTLHLNEPRICLKFDYDQYIVDLLKSNFTSLKRSKTLDCFHIAADKNYRSDLYKSFKGVAWLEFKKPDSSVKIKKTLPSDLLAPQTELNSARINEFKDFLRSRRYSESTIKTYTDAIGIFLRFHAEKALEEIDNQDLIAFNNDYILKNKFSSSYQNQVVNGVKLFFRAINGYKMDIDLIHRPRREKVLPNVLSKEEVKTLLTVSSNQKHRLMLSLIYACGLRRSELLHLKPQDILSDRNLLFIRQSKGKKDRIVPLSETLLQQLREYYKFYKPKIWLFEGQFPGNQYSAKSLQNVLNQTLSKTNITKPVTLHWLRHSYATHLLESGTDLRYIQELLGHSSSKTTEIYTHVTNKSIQQIRSPFDNL